MHFGRYFFLYYFGCMTFEIQWTKKKVSKINANEWREAPNMRIV